MHLWWWNLGQYPPPLQSRHTSTAALGSISHRWPLSIYPLTKIQASSLARHHHWRIWYLCHLIPIFGCRNTPFERRYLYLHTFWGPLCKQKWFIGNSSHWKMGASFDKSFSIKPAVLWRLAQWFSIATFSIFPSRWSSFMSNCRFSRTDCLVPVRTTGASFRT